MGAVTVNDRVMGDLRRVHCELFDGSSGELPGLRAGGRAVRKRFLKLRYPTTIH